MALISEIRKRSMIVLIVIGLALVAFLLMDSIQSQRGALGPNTRTPFATLDGEEIAVQEYNQYYQNTLNRYLVVNNLAVPFYYTREYKLDAATKFQLEEEAWNNLVSDKIMTEQMEKAGIRMTDAEFSNLIYGPQPHRFIAGLYQNINPSGQYDPANPQALSQYVNYISNPENQNQNPQIIGLYFDFVVREKEAKKDYYYNKYINAVQKAVYVPGWLAKDDFINTQKKISFSFVDLPYRSVKDDEVSFEESEVTAWFNEHKSEYKQSEERTIEYVSFPVIATSADTARVLKRLIENQQNWEKAQSDSSFLQVYSDDELKFNRIYYSQKDLYNTLVDSTVAQAIFNTDSGSYYGPYYESGSFKYAKVMGHATMPDSANVRHILVSLQTRDSADAKLRADSIMSVLNNGGDFADLASRLSDDSGSAPAGGELGWSTPNNNFVKPFSNYIFNGGKAGEVKIVKTAFGYHIIEIEEFRKVEDYTQVVFLTHEISPSEYTEDSVDNLAGTFYERNGTIEKWDNAISEQGLNKRISPAFTKNQFQIVGLPDSRSLILWAYGANEGEFKYFTLDDQYVVAKLSKVREEGEAQLEDVRTQIEAEVIKEKKAEMLMSKMQDAMNGSSDLEDIAGKLDAQVKSVPDVTFSAAYAPQLGAEPLVIGRLFAMQTGMMDGPLKGDRGVFVFRLDEVTDAPEQTDFTINEQRLRNAELAKINLASLEGALKEDHKIEDNRYKY